MTRPVRLAAALAASILSLASAVPASAAGAPKPEVRGVMALYEGRWIDLSVSWQGAVACDATHTPVTCYSSEAEMDAAQPVSSTSTLSADATTAAATAGSCSTYLRLYDGTSYAGSILSLAIEGTFITLSNYGFDNRTSSYKIGGCAAAFYSGSSGGGSIYPGNTNSYALSAVMLSGWDNVVSSVYIA